MGNFSSDRKKNEGLLLKTKCRVFCKAIFFSILTAVLLMPVSCNGLKDKGLYDGYSQRISDGLAEFSALINSSKDFGPVSELEIESVTVNGISAEGAELTRFMTPDGDIARYTLNIFGETGKSAYNYYCFSDGILYVQHLVMDYTDWNFSPENRFDILRYSLLSYVIDGKETYLIYDGLKQVLKAENSGLYTIDELNYLFDNGLN